MAGLLKSLGLASTIFMSLSPLVNAHMQMIWPIPFNSIEDPSYYGNKVDYSMTSPLLTDGSNYPCKGYQTEGLNKIQATYIPGQTYNLTLAGSATHDGGSCQISLSYDNGKSFHVIKSMIGGCPLTPTWDFQIPASAASSNFTLLAWTWFNLVGNREMYMNCARVAIQPSASSRRLIRGKIKRDAQDTIPLVNLPNNFACNIGNGCQTIEDHEVVFPNPGPVVQLGQDAISASAGPGYTITGATPTGNAFSSPTATSRTGVASSSGFATRKTSAISKSTPLKSSKAQTSLVQVTSSRSTGSVTDTASVTEPPSTSTSTSPPPTLVKSTTAIVSVTEPCSSPTTTKPPTTLVKSTMAAVSRDTACTESTTTTSSRGRGCTPGAIRCDSPTTWSMCVPTASGGGTWTFMGSVAAGTTCKRGVIG